MPTARISGSGFRYGRVVTCAEMDGNRSWSKGDEAGWSKATQKFSNGLASRATLRRMLVRFIASRRQPLLERSA